MIELITENSQLFCLKQVHALDKNLKKSTWYQNNKPKYTVQIAKPSFIRKPVLIIKFWVDWRISLI